MSWAIAFWITCSIYAFTDFLDFRRDPIRHIERNMRLGRSQIPVVLAWAVFCWGVVILLVLGGLKLLGAV